MTLTEVLNSTGGFFYIRRIFTNGIYAFSYVINVVIVFTGFTR
jgi:hypothetical protein